MSLGEMLQQMNADTINKFAPYTTDYIFTNGRYIAK